MALYCHKHDQPFVITSTVSTLQEDIKLKRKSNSHRTFRAADLRSVHYSAFFLQKFVDHFSKKYAKFAAVSKKTGKPRLIYVHASNGAEHIHVQINAKYAHGLH